MLYMEAVMNKTVAGIRRYVIEFSIGMGLFFATMLLSRTLASAFPEWKVFLYLLPCLPILLVAAAIWRGIAVMDEYHRRNAINGVAFGAFFLGIFACFYPFLRAAGLIPEMNFSMAWPVMAAGWIIASFAYMWRDGVSTFGRGKTVGQFVVFFLFLAGAALLYWLAAPVAGWPQGWGALLAAAGFGAIPAALYQVLVRPCGHV
jgi:hypothetical protein